VVPRLRVGARLSVLPRPARMRLRKPTEPCSMERPVTLGVDDAADVLTQAPEQAP
jgi:hypothetical protein